MEIYLANSNILLNFQAMNMKNAVRVYCVKYVSNMMFTLFIVFYATYGALCYQLVYFSSDHLEDICIRHHLISNLSQ